MNEINNDTPEFVPELLEALQALSDLPEYDGTVATSRQRLAVKRQVKAAIAKATGETK